MDILPYVVLALGVVSGVVWWMAYLKEARNPERFPPNMWLVSAVHLVAIPLGFVAPFLWNYNADPLIVDGNKQYYLNLGALHLTDQQFYYDLAVGVSLLVLATSLIIAAIRAAR